jgi:hypothetical protein
LSPQHRAKSSRKNESTSFEKVERLKYLGTAATDKIKSGNNEQGLNSGKA